MITPAVKIRTHPVIINVGVAALRHPFQDPVDLFKSARDDEQRLFQFFRLSVTHSALRINNRSKGFAGASLDGDMDQDKPFFVQPAKKVLAERDIPQGDWTIRINPAPIV